MAEFVVSFAVKMIGDLLIKEAKLLFGVSGQVQDILAELRRIQCFLKDADARQDEHETLRNLVVEIREVAYDVEDVIATFVFEVAPLNRPNIFVRSALIFKELRARHTVGCEIRSIKTKITGLTASLQSYGVIAMMGREGPSHKSRRRTQLRRTYSHVVEEDFVGFEDDIDTVAEKVVSEDPCYRVVSIWGMGGIGKTTLAKKVYHHPDVRRGCYRSVRTTLTKKDYHHQDVMPRCFDAFAWVSISQQWQQRDVLEKILTALLNPQDSWSIRGMIDDLLVKRLYEFLEKKRCLVVLDDIWSSDAWDCLLPALGSRNSRSKIMLTTRNRDVAMHVDPLGFGLHKLNCLSRKDSSALFWKKVEVTGYPGFQTNAMMHLLGWEMVQQCGGLPLAIVVLGGLLATKRTLIEWKEVHQNVVSSLTRGQGYGVGQLEHGRILKVLALSYQDLPYQLKACFLYLANYREDFDIEVEILYQLWMAEGIMSASREDEGNGGEKTLMDMADDCLSELAHRCMVQVELEPEDEYYSPIIGRRRRFKYCRLHDLMRELCLKKVKEENFLKVIDYQHRNEQVPPPSTSSMAASSSGGCSCCKPRRLAIYLDNNSIGNVRREEITRNIRTVLFFRTKELRFGEELAPYHEEFKLLNILNFLDFGEPEVSINLGERLTKAIGDLILLRYLGLRGTTFFKLPSSIGNLRYLQTLDLRVNSREISLPNVLWKMEGLVHLYLPRRGGFKTKGKLRVDGLSKLETLENFHSDKVDVKGFFTLTNLRRLTGLIWKSNEDLATVTNYLQNNHKLQHTSIEVSHVDFCSEEELRQLLKCDCLVELTIIGFMFNLPEYDDEPLSRSLAKLKLVDFHLREDPMKTLERLPNLRILELGSGAFMGKEMVCRAGGFPHLKKLLLLNLRELEKWRVDNGAMSNLSFLKIFRCRNLQRLPAGLGFVSSLQELDVRMPKAFNDRLRVVDGEKGDEFDKVCHVPSITLTDDD